MIKERARIRAKTENMMREVSFKAVAQRAVRDYNKYRSPEAKATLIEIAKNRLIMDFSGSFCRGCGASDYFEDFIHELKRYVKVRMKISSFEQTEQERFRVIYTFELKE